jgi:glycosyltransferase involved in cell wall biosynthesis
MKGLIFLISHPIQYYTPLYRDIAEENFTDIEVVYCSDESIEGKKDKEFGVNIKWDIPLLEGYRYTFLKNSSFKPSIHYGFWGLMNWGIIPYLFKKPKSVIVIHGWGYFTNILAILFGKIAGHSVCIRGDTPFHQEVLKNKWITKCKHIYLKILFLLIDYFLYIGFQNKLFYSSLGAKDKQLFFTPFSVDNDRFQKAATSMTKEMARERLRLLQNKKIILFSAKYIPKKRPMDLLQAINLLQYEDFLLVMMGEGELRREMEVYIRDYKLEDKVLLTGFVNQSEVIYYYKSADVFVMCSGLGENWGLSVNEAMNFDLPVIISETSGCSYDLVENGKNGFVFKTGDIKELTHCLEKVLCSTEARISMGQRSREIINNYSNQKIISSLELLCKK